MTTSLYMDGREVVCFARGEMELRYSIPVGDKFEIDIRDSKYVPGSPTAAMALISMVDHEPYQMLVPQSNRAATEGRSVTASYGGHEWKLEKVDFKGDLGTRFREWLDREK